MCNMLSWLALMGLQAKQEEEQQKAQEDAKRRQEAIRKREEEAAQRRYIGICQCVSRLCTPTASAFTAF